MQMVLTLVEPQSSGIGGGAFILYWDGERVQAFDARQRRVTEQLFLQADGEPMPFRQAQIGGRSVGCRVCCGRCRWPTSAMASCPGATCLHRHRLGPQRLCSFPRLHTLIAGDPFIAQSPAMARYFLDEQGRPLPVGRPCATRRLPKPWS